MFSTIISIIAAAVALVALYFTMPGIRMSADDEKIPALQQEIERIKVINESREKEKISTLQHEIEWLKVLKESQDEKLLPLSTGRVLDYLRNEKGWNTEFKDSDEVPHIAFQVGDTYYHLLVAGQPTVIISLGYNMENSKIDWGVLRKAAFSANQDLNMVTFKIWEGKAYSMYIESREHNMHNFKLSLDWFLSMLDEAQRLLYHYYNEYSNPKKDADGLSDTERLTNYMMQYDGLSKKMMS